jgi:hypothetical protein
MNNKIFVIVMVLVFLVVGFSGCQDISETINPPSIIVSSETDTEGYEGLDKVGYVEVTVTNNGGEGRGTVNVIVTQGQKQWAKTQNVYLKNGESETITFKFKEIEFWTFDSWSSVVSII